MNIMNFVDLHYVDYKIRFGNVKNLSYIVYNKETLTK
jgi:hypothetical protein